MPRPPIGRLVALLCVTTLALGVIFARLTILQVSQAADLRDLAADQRVRTVVQPAQRGQILDRTGEQLALSMPARDLYADPRYVVDVEATAAALAPLLEQRERELVQKLSEETTFVFLARQVDPDLAERVTELELPGIGSLEVSKRHYPAGPLAGQVLGFVDIDGTGIAGLELQYQHLLAGEDGRRTQELDPHGLPIVGGVDVGVPPVPGSSIETTIDRDLQYQAQSALRDVVRSQQARGGTVIVMDPRTGDILAMTSYPWFNPNLFPQAEPSTYRPRAVTDVFEPGSTNKVITAAAAVQERALPLEQRLAVDWTMRVGLFTIHDASPHPVERMTLADIITRSSNIGIVHVAERVGQVRMAAYLSRFGLGSRTGVDFPGEAPGITLPLSEWTDTTLATASYGQGLASSPLQMAAVYATIANDGRWVRPRLVRATVGPDGVRREVPSSPTRRVVSAATAQMVTRMLASAVEHGTGVNARIEGYQVAGKTGTARIPLPDRPGYFKGQYIASFIGYLPAGDPQVVVAAMLDRPAQGYGSLAAAPLFQRVARAAIARLGIEPGEVVPPPPHALPLR
ncbi:MAG TPA: penicillin-binding protein 2 [Actinomycetota bacterium]